MLLARAVARACRVGRAWHLTQADGFALLQASWLRQLNAEVLCPPPAGLRPDPLLHPLADTASKKYTKPRCRSRRPRRPVTPAGHAQTPLLFSLYHPQDFSPHLFGIGSGRRTRITSSPICSMSHQSTRIGSHFENDSSFPSGGISMDTTRPHSTSISRSQTNPSRLPSQMFMTSLFFSSENVQIRIKQYTSAKQYAEM